MIEEALAEKRALVTGATGFLGQALLERLLGDFPETRVVLLVRGRFGQPARARVEELLGRPCFNPLRERVGPDGIAAMLEERIEVLEGDVTGELPPLPDDLDLVFHCAATVSFDPPIDEGFRTNLVGTTGLYEAVAASGARPYLIHTSTAYVAGMTKGIVPEAPLSHRIDWRAETAAALAARARVEEASRRPEMLDHFVARARHEHGRAGPQEVAQDSERRREDWVNRRLVEYGRARAQTMGWPDLYTFTKALGERAAEELRGDLPLAIVRPSIIESALRHPYPGWIEGFKMAEPIILAFGRGAIPEFPGIPEGILDLIPVDYVVNALLAVAATPPEDGVEYYHVSSGSRNPVHYHRVYELVRDYFQKDPLPERDRGFHRVPEWRFPGRRRVERLLRTGEKALDLADRVVTRLPRSDRVRSMVRRVDRERGRLDFIRRYADLYAAYVEAEVIYTDDRSLALHRSLPDEERERFGFDVADIDWRHYLQDVHCPAVTVAMRFPSPRRPDPEVRVRPREQLTLAVFDMEGTILSSNVIESYLWLRFADVPAEEWPDHVASVARQLPSLLGAERRDRGEFLRAFYRRYDGASVEGIARLVEEHVAEMLLQRVAPAAVRRIREHRRAGHRTVLLTGALEPFAEPFRPLFDEVVAAKLMVRDGRYTGYLETPPLVGEARAAWLRGYAEGEGADLKGSYAYADSHTDLPLLRAVGNPVAVNPDVALYRVARKRRWPVEVWKHSSGTPRVMVPERV
ncbi:MAG: HAD-IB family hydrolase [Actinobacteria bacterium]|nr:HAD-IB family hydrolase [Actinomycetota bacterium]